ncbi:MAG: helix-turn-helix domain-containing protein [SAR324 cluster bacterium]|nr:helix-turn-helix domain-containing protein [SAR324 cluster bacterium]
MNILNKDQILKLKNIGQAVKNRREELSHSLSYVADVIRIPIADLKAIEMGDYQTLPKLIFLKGFIRSYCKFLDTDSQWMIDDINKAFNEESVETLETNNDKIDSEKPTKNKSLPQVLSATFFLAVVLVGGYFIFTNFADSPSQNKELALPIFEKSDEPTAAQNDDEPIIPPKKSYAMSFELVGKADGWLSFKIGENLPKESPIQPGQIINWVADEDAEIILSRGDVATLTINGVEEVILESEYNKIYRRIFKK